MSAYTPKMNPMNSGLEIHPFIDCNELEKLTLTSLRRLYLTGILSSILKKLWDWKLSVGMLTLMIKMCCQVYFFVHSVADCAGIFAIVIQCHVLDQQIRPNDLIAVSANKKQKKKNWLHLGLKNRGRVSRVSFVDLNTKRREIFRERQQCDRAVTLYIIFCTSRVVAQPNAKYEYLAFACTLRLI